MDFVVRLAEHLQSMSNEIRAFFALTPDDDAVQQLLARCESLKSKGWHKLARFNSAENLHLTLRFLGEVEPETFDKLREGAREIAASIQPFDYEIGAAKLFPRVSRARVIVADVEAPSQLRELNRGLERLSVAHGLAEEKFTYRPHVTLARLSPGQKRPNLPSYSAPILQHAKELALYRSTLHPDGAQYEILETYPFGEA